MQDYTKYRWFFTSSEKLVVGGKNAKQNEELVKSIMKKNKKYVVMHTSEPGSPFSFILSEDTNESDLEETAIFTGCFSRAWRNRKRKADVDIFVSDQICKTKSMKEGTFGVTGKIKRKSVELKLALTKQKDVLRAVPLKTAEKEEVLLSIMPGNTEKEKVAEEIARMLDLKKQDVLQAIPSGGFRICKDKAACR